MIQRELYLKRLRPFYSSELIKVITGVRRCGKSTLLKQIARELADQGVAPDHILFINFEDYAYKDLANPDRFHAFVEQWFPSEGKSYLLFDEIQNVKDFELVVNSFRATRDVSIFLTGSNSKLLSGELSTHLGGRTVSFTMMPFTFKEFCTFKGQDASQDLLKEYITWGGFPLVCAAPTEEMKVSILSNLYDSIVLKDIIMRNRIASVHALERVVEYLVSSSSLTLSGTSVSKALRDVNQQVSAPTVYDYIAYCVQACVIAMVQRYDIRGKKVLAFEEKSYVIDLGLFHLKKNRVKDEFGMIVETLVHNELIARGFSVYLGKTNKSEVDFIASGTASSGPRQKKCYIQTAYRMDSPETIEREFASLHAIDDNYPKYVVSNDDWSLGEQDGIIHIPLLKFLMDESLVGWK